MDEYAATRRRFIGVCTALGISSSLFVGVLQALAEERSKMLITNEMINQAAAFAGIQIAPENAEAMKAQLNSQVAAFESIRQLKLNNAVQPAYSFNALLPGSSQPPAKRPLGAKSRSLLISRTPRSGSGRSISRNWPSPPCGN